MPTDSTQVSSLPCWKPTVQRGCIWIQICWCPCKVGNVCWLAPQWTVVLSSPRGRGGSRTADCSPRLRPKHELWIMSNILAGHRPRMVSEEGRQAVLRSFIYKSVDLRATLSSGYQRWGRESTSTVNGRVKQGHSAGSPRCSPASLFLMIHQLRWKTKPVIHCLRGMKGTCPTLSIRSQLPLHQTIPGPCGAASSPLIGTGLPGDQAKNNSQHPPAENLPTDDRSDWTWLSAHKAFTTLPLLSQNWMQEAKVFASVCIERLTNVLRPSRHHQQRNLIFGGGGRNCQSLSRPRALVFRGTRLPPRGATLQPQQKQWVVTAWCGTPLPTLLLVGVLPREKHCNAFIILQWFSLVGSSFSIRKS